MTLWSHWAENARMVYRAPYTCVDVPVCVYCCALCCPTVVVCIYVLCTCIAPVQYTCTAICACVGVSAGNSNGGLVALSGYCAPECAAKLRQSTTDVALAQVCGLTPE